MIDDTDMDKDKEEGAPEEKGAPEPRAQAPEETLGDMSDEDEGEVEDKPAGDNVIPLATHKLRPKYVDHIVEQCRTTAEITGDGMEDRRLDNKERMFVELIVDGQSPSQAYKGAYPEQHEISTRAAYDNAKRLMMRSYISRAIVGRVDETRGSEDHTGVRLRRFIAMQLEDIAATSQSDTARISALEKLGKMYHVGAFEERSHVVVAPETPSEISAEIARRLAKVKGTQGK